MNQIDRNKTDLFFNKKLFEISWKNPGSQLGSSACDPSLTQYILGKRENSNIFNFDHTLICIERCLKLIAKIVASNGKILIVSTDSSSSSIVRKVGQLSSQPFIDAKWINGLLTNWKQIIPSKQNNLFKSRRKSDSTSFLAELPAALIVINPNENADAIREARKLNIPVISFLNTKKKSNLRSEININQMDYVIPSSGSSTQTVYFFFDLFLRIIRKDSYFIKLGQKSYQYNYKQATKCKYEYIY